MDRRLVRDIRVLISAPRRIELAGAVDAEQAVVAGLVQVNDPREAKNSPSRMPGLKISLTGPKTFVREIKETSIEEKSTGSPISSGVT